MNFFLLLLLSSQSHASYFNLGKLWWRAESNVNSPTSTPISPKSPHVPFDSSNDNSLKNSEETLNSEDFFTLEASISPVVKYVNNEEDKEVNVNLNKSPLDDIQEDYIPVKSTDYITVSNYKDEDCYLLIESPPAVEKLKTKYLLEKETLPLINEVSFFAVPNEVKKEEKEEEAVQQSILQAAAADKDEVTIPFITQQNMESPKPIIAVDVKPNPLRPAVKTAGIKMRRTSPGSPPISKPSAIEDPLKEVKLEDYMDKPEVKEEIDSLGALIDLLCEKLQKCSCSPSPADSAKNN